MTIKLLLLSVMWTWLLSHIVIIITNALIIFLLSWKVGFSRILDLFYGGFWRYSRVLL